MATCPYRVAAAVEPDLPPVEVMVATDPEDPAEVDELAPLIGAPRLGFDEPLLHADKRREMQIMRLVMPLMALIAAWLWFLL